MSTPTTMPNLRPIVRPTDPRLIAFARLVQSLRAVQKTSGSGYKDAESGTKATAIGKQVDAEIAAILTPPKPPCHG